MFEYMYKFLRKKRFHFFLAVFPNILCLKILVFISVGYEQGIIHILCLSLCKTPWIGLLEYKTFMSNISNDSIFSEE